MASRRAPNPSRLLLRSHQLDRQPMIARSGGRGLGVQQDAFAAQHHDEGVHVAVVVVIAKAGAAPDFLELEIVARLRGHIGERRVAVIAEQGIFHGNQPVQAAVHDEQILPPVVVVIVKAVAPCHVLAGNRRHARLHRGVEPEALARRDCETGGDSACRRQTDPASRRCRSRRRWGSWRRWLRRWLRRPCSRPAPRW